MNFWDSFIIIFLIAILNVTVYMVFVKYLYGKEDSGMKFLAVNMAKDLIWLVVSLLIADKTKANFLLIVICFIIASFLIYMSVIKKINKS